MNRVAQRLAVIGWLAIVGIALLRVMTEHTLLPYWDIDPLMVDIPETRLTPAMSLAMDVAVWIGSLALLIGQWLTKQRLMWRSGILLAVAACGVFWHAELATPYGTAPGRFSGHPDGLVIGSSWLAAMVGAWSLSHLARKEAWRRLTIVTLLGVIFVLVGDGIVQVSIEHAQTLAEYRSNPELFLGARAIESGSIQALDFERRLSNPEAVGWFGLTNVFATFAAAVVGAGAGLILFLLSRSSDRSSTVLVAALLMLAAGLTGLWLSGAKGGYGATFVSIFAVLAVYLIRRGIHTQKIEIADPPKYSTRFKMWFIETSGWMIGAVVILLPILLVVSRGLIGERIGETSILFRWHYFVASARILLEFPLVGVGPGTFQDAYARAKPIINPEWISSPHNVIFEWIATLGFAGVALAIVWCWFVCSSAHRAIDCGMRTTAQEAPFPKRFIVLGGLAAIGASFIAWSMDALVTTNASMAGRSLGLIVWMFVLICFAFSKLPTTATALAGFGAVAAIASHSQIEVTATHPGAAAWCALMLSTCAPSHESRIQMGRGIRAYIPAIILLGIGAATTISAGRRAGAWEAILREGRETAQRAAATDEIRYAIQVAADTMGSAEQVWPGRLKLRTNEVGLRLALKLQNSEAQSLMDLVIRDFPHRSGTWITQGQMILAGGQEGHAQAAMDSFEIAYRLDPGSLQIALAGLRAAIAADSGQTAMWAGRVLKIDDSLRLDPLKRLSADERWEIEEILELSMP